MNTRKQTGGASPGRRADRPSPPAGRPMLSAHAVMHGVALLALASTTGCGNGLAKLEGEVCLDGEPLRAVDEIRGTVMFQPLQSGPSAAATIDEQGRYEAYTGAERGLPPGDYVVTLRAVEIIPAKDEYSMPGAKKITPRRFANSEESGLTVTVSPGSNAFDIDIVSK